MKVLNSIRPAILIGLLAMSLRLLVVIASPLLYEDVIIDQYDVIAQNMLSGHGFGYIAGQTIPTVTRAPFYPFWLAFVFSIFGKNFLVLRLFEALIDTVTTLLVYILVNRNASFIMKTKSGSKSHRLALFASGVYALQPFTIYYTVKLGPESWFTFWLLLALVMYFEFLRYPRLKTDVLLGLCLAVSALNKSVALFLPFLWCLLALAMGILCRRTFAHFALVVGIMIGALLPWMIRNYQVTSGAFVPVQTLIWWNFWYDFDVRPGEIGSSLNALYPTWGGHPYSLSAPVDVRQEAYFADRALEWIRASPHAFMIKTLKNIGEFWYLTETKSKVLIVLVWQFLQLPFVIVGIIIGFRMPRRILVVFCVSTVLCFNLIYAPVFSVFRYSLVAVPLLSILIAMAILDVDQRMKAAVSLKKRNQRNG